MGENTQEDESGLLTIHNVTRAHAGLYQCTADNGIAPPASAGVQLVVQCEFLAFLFHLTAYRIVHTHASMVTHPHSGTSEQTQTLVYSCAVAPGS